MTEIIPSINQTKDWRKSCEWYKDGRRNECEVFQRKSVEKITGLMCVKTTTRINLRTGEMRENASPLTHNDGFDWSEDFDGKMTNLDGANIWVNLKMVCNSGGSQTRSLREVYHFVEGQLRVLAETNDTPTPMFVNILDGNESHKHSDKFRHLIASVPNAVRENIFVGDMCEFQQWWSDKMQCI
jgi:hypothetical protein